VLVALVLSAPGACTGCADGNLGGPAVAATGDGELEEGPWSAHPVLARTSSSEVRVATVGATPEIELNVLLVRVPRARRHEVAKVWSHLDEDFLDSARLLQVRRNGIRVGVGRVEQWGAIKSALDSVPEQQARALDPLRLPLEYPLALELDDEPREQDLFVVDSDGVLSGGTWRASRNVLCVSCGLDPYERQRAQLSVVPEVRQRQPGWEWIRTEAGLWQLPKHGGQAFPAAGFTVGLEPGQFVLIAPSENADTAGLIGSAFLAKTTEGKRWDSYVFLRPVIDYGDQHNP